MARPRSDSPYSASNRKQGLWITAGSILLIALIDRVALPTIPMGFLYLYPIIIGGGFLARWQALLLAAFCGLLTWNAYPASINAQMLLIGGSFGVAGLFAAQLGHNRRRLEDQLRELDIQQKLRKEAEEDFHALIETSTAAILSVDSGGFVLNANRSAETLLGFEKSSLKGKSIIPYLPFLANILNRSDASGTFRAMTEGRGRRRDGSLFFAYVWFSTYSTSSGSRLAAIVWDASEQVREREEVGLRQLLSSSRIFMGAMSHEVRNLCAAISVVYLNLKKHAPDLVGNPDFEALGQLVESLRQLASAELKAAAPGSLEGVNLAELLEEVQLIATPATEQEDVSVRFEIEPDLPPVRADRPALLQVLLNLLNNAIRAAGTHPERLVTVVVFVLQGTVVIRVCNRGGVIEAHEQLFQPFHEGATSTGLGLYVSRAILRTFGGELRYTPEAERHCFRVELKPAANGASAAGAR